MVSSYKITSTEKLKGHRYVQAESNTSHTLLNLHGLSFYQLWVDSWCVNEDLGTVFSINVRLITCYLSTKQDLVF